MTCKDRYIAIFAVRIMSIKLKYLPLILLLCGGLSLSAQMVNAPELTCVQVADNGYALLSWTPPTDASNTFVDYHIWRANSAAGPYVEITSLNPITTSGYTHVTTTPLTSNLCYYIVTEYTNGPITAFSAPSDTLCTISLDVAPSVTPLGYAELNWSQPYASVSATPPGVTFDIQMEYPIGTWASVATVPMGTFSLDHEITLCQEFLNFRVLVEDPNGCVFNSDVEGDLFEDQVAPAIPEITSISIDHTSNDAVVSWNASPSLDTQGYILYTCSDVNAAYRDTVWGYNSTTWTDLTAPTLLGPVCYLVAAFDTCYTGTPPSPNTSPTSDICNCSIFLDPVSYGVCDNFVNLSWSAYTGWLTGVATYTIFHNIDGGAYENIGTVDGNTTTFVHSFPTIESGNHGYFIQATSNVTNFTSQSNLRLVSILYPESPAYSYLAAATVNEDNELIVQVAAEQTPTEHIFYVERLRQTSGEWEEVNTGSNFLSNFIEIPDNTADPTTSAHTYRVISENVCSVPVDTTNIGTSMLLQGVASQGQAENVLDWSFYSGWDNGVSSYRIWRSIGTDGTPEMISEIDPSRRYFIDDLEDLIFTPGEFCYRIEAVEQPNSVPGSAFSAFSNTLCLVQEPIIWVPNAFVVDGVNTTFFPVISFANFEKYQLFVYSRWGDVIFETTDINAHWDGTMNGEIVQEGMYIYYISVEDGKGRPHEVRGKVLMLSERPQ